MSLFDCIGRAVAAREMPRQQGEAMQDLVQRLEAEYAHLGPAGAAAQAAIDAKKVLREATDAKRRAVLAQIAAQRRLAADIDGYVDIRGGAEQHTALNALLEYDQAARFPSVRGVREGLRARYHRLIADFLDRHKKDLLGRVRRKAELPALVREMMGEASGDASARELAQAVTAAFEQARLDFNAAGGHIGKLDDFGLPHRHDAARMRDARFDKWADEIGLRLDWARIRDFQTGRPFSGSSQPRRRAFLLEVFNEVTTDGWSKREPSTRAQGRSLHNRRADHRLLHFLSADDWLAYNEAFGASDPFSTIVGHLDQMARDTALMRVLGPNPRGGLEFAIQHLQKKAATTGWKVTGADRVKRMTPVDQVRAQAGLARAMFRFLAGGEAGGDRFIAETMATTRTLLTAAQLGGAFLSSLGDVFFGGLGARHVGMPPLQPLARQFRLMASGGLRTEALRQGVLADMHANAGVAASRYMMEGTPANVADRLLDFTLRASYLTQWTEYGRWSWALSLADHLQENFGRSWAELPDPLRRLFLERRGFTPADWDSIRTAPLMRTPEGADVFVPDLIRSRMDMDPEAAEGLALRLTAAIQEQVEFAVPSYSVRGRANLIGETQAGTFVGEVARSVAGYRGFTMALMANNIRRVVAADLRDPRVMSIAGFIALTTFSGMMALQLKEIAKGRDPRQMDDFDFWQAAMLQGGGLGILGDFVMAEENRFGGGLAETLAGPVVGLAADLTRVAVQNGMRAADGEDTTLGRDVSRLVRRYTPGANIWYWSLAMQRLAFDTLQRALDPEADAAWSRAERRRASEYGNEAWWRPGKTAPDRPPEFSAAMGGP